MALRYIRGQNFHGPLVRTLRMTVRDNGSTIWLCARETSCYHPKEAYPVWLIFVTSRRVTVSGQKRSNFFRRTGDCWPNEHAFPPLRHDYRLGPSGMP